MNIEKIFDTPIFYDFLNLDLKALEEYAYRLQGQSNGVQFSNMGGWQSLDVSEDEELKEFKNIINTKLIEIAKYNNIKSNFNLSMTNVWININSKHNYNTNHVHYNSFYSGVFYIKVPKNSGRINFKTGSQFHKCFMTHYKKFVDSYNTSTAQTWTYDSRSNMLLLFPSWIEHDVDQNLSDFDRISIAFNTDIK